MLAQRKDDTYFWTKVPGKTQLGKASATIEGFYY